MLKLESRGRFSSVKMKQPTSMNDTLYLILCVYLLVFSFEIQLNLNDCCISTVFSFFFSFFLSFAVSIGGGALTLHHLIEIIFIVFVLLSKWAYECLALSHTYNQIFVSLTSNTFQNSFISQTVAIVRMNVFGLKVIWRLMVYVLLELFLSMSEKESERVVAIVKTTVYMAIRHYDVNVTHLNEFLYTNIRTITVEVSQLIIWTVLEPNNCDKTFNRHVWVRWNFVGANISHMYNV